METQLTTSARGRYMREYQSLGTAGGLYHFRDTILKGNPDQIFVLHADIACAFVSFSLHSLALSPRKDPTQKYLLFFSLLKPLEELKDFHDKHRGVGTVMGVKVCLTSITFSLLAHSGIVNRFQLKLPINLVVS